MFDTIQKQDDTYILHSYGRINVAIESGAGTYATDVQGKDYLDFTSGIGVNALGYSHPAWVQAVCAQAARVQHISNYYYSPVCTDLAQKLATLSGMSRGFFCNSGAEANECAVKIARKLGAPKGANQIITLINSFHGRTITTLAATGQASFHQDFLPLTEGFAYCAAGDLEALKAMVTTDTCGIMLECVQGEGGVLPMEQAYLQAVRALCDEKGIALIIDEVQTGVGRTGYLYAYQEAGILPDVMTTAKGLGGGLPIGACLVNQAHKDIFVPGNNGSTFGGNPVSCAGALAILEVVAQPAFLAEVQAKGRYFQQKLEQMPQVDFVRGKGLMLGIALKKANARDVLVACAEQGLLVLTAKDLVRFLPPLNISYQEIDKGLAIFQQVLKGLD